MWRNILCAAFVLTVCLGLATAETLKGRITKSDDKTITVVTKKGEDGKAYDLAKDVKIFKKDGDNKVEVKREDFKVGEKGTFATITTNDDGKVTEIVTGGGKKKTN
jgi:acyl-coenzyme A synthetase/AMP-(fatty) acid ligase